MRLDSLRVYVLVSQDRAFIETYTRQGDGWHFTSAEGMDATVTLTPLDCTLPLVDIYDGVTLTLEDAEDGGNPPDT